MRCCPQGGSEAWKLQGNWTWAILGSILVHALLLSGMLLGFRDGPAQKRVVVPVEAIALVPGAPGGGGGRCGPTTRPQTVAAKPKPVRPRPKPRPQRRVKSKPRPKLKLTPRAPEPTKTPVIPTPAAAPARTRSKVAPPAAASRARASSAAPGASGSGQGGRRGGRGTGTGVGSGQGRGSGAGSALQGYLQVVRRQLEKQKKYPFMARRRQIQGVVVLLFTIAASGQVQASRINRSSGSDLLDEAARNTVRRIRRFPPFPPALNRRQLTVQVPLAFRLEND